MSNDRGCWHRTTARLRNRPLVVNTGRPAAAVDAVVLWWSFVRGIFPTGITRIWTRLFRPKNKTFSRINTVCPTSYYDVTSGESSRLRCTRQHGTNWIDLARVRYSRCDEDNKFVRFTRFVTRACTALPCAVYKRRVKEKQPPTHYIVSTRTRFENCREKHGLSQTSASFGATKSQAWRERLYL